MWCTLCPCDRCGRGDESPEGSTASRAYRRAAYHTPERGGGGEKMQIRTGTHRGSEVTYQGPSHKIV